MPKAAQPKRPAPPTSIISASDDAILHALVRYSYLSSVQVCRLLYSPASLSWVQSKLKRLVELAYIQRVFLPRPSQFGSAPSLYTLANKSLRHLAAHGVQVPRRYRPSEQQGSYLFLHHTGAVADVLISLELLCARRAQLELRELRPERLLKRDPACVVDVDRRRVAVIPDAWVDLVLDGADEMPIAFEIDRGSEEQKKWRRKVRALVAWSQGPYQEKFHTTSLTIVVVATPGAKRLRDLLHWTEAELVVLDQTQEADLFRFAGLAPDSVGPEEFFLAPRWFRPFQPDATPLFELDPPRTAAQPPYTYAIARPTLAVAGP